jgi:hypothetical protein
MKQYVGLTPQMQNSIGHYEHQGMFQIALNRILTEEQRKNLAIQLEFWPSDIDRAVRDAYAFTSTLHNRGIYGERVDNRYDDAKRCYVNTVSDRYAHNLKKAAIQLGYVEVTKACNRWMGLDENDGVPQTVPQVVQQQNSNPTIDNRLIQPPERLRDALNHQDFNQTFARIFIELNELNPKTNLTGWQTLMNQFLTLEFSPKLKSDLFSGTSKNPSELLVMFIAQNTVTTLSAFCDIIKNPQIGLAKYADQLASIHAKCIEKFKAHSEQMYSDKSEIYGWCNQKDLAFLIPILEKEGFSALEDIADITEKDLEDLGVTLMGQRKKIMRAISTLKVNSNN